MKEHGLHIKTDQPICGSRELEFSIFCIENVASKVHVDTQRVYAALTGQTDILQEYIIPEYECCTRRVRITLWMILSML